MNKNLKTEVDDSWRRKGHIHDEDLLIPIVCPACKGTGTVNLASSEPYMIKEVECFKCGGEGAVYD